MPVDTQTLKVKVTNLQRNTASLMELLGSKDDKLHFFEILKGITTPAVLHIVETQLEVLDQQLKSVNTMVKTLQSTAKELNVR